MNVHPTVAAFSVHGGIFGAWHRFACFRQNLSNKQPEFNAWFFSTVQIVFAGNDSEGLKYGAVETQEKYFLRWKEDEADNSRFKLDKYLLKMCDKKRLLELMHDFVLFDGGVNRFMPKWQHCRQMLNRLPVRHETWGY